MQPISHHRPNVLLSAFNGIDDSVPKIHHRKLGLLRNGDDGLSVLLGDFRSSIERSRVDG